MKSDVCLYQAGRGEARWINPENPDGRKGGGGISQGGRKGAPCYGKVLAGQTLVLADLLGTSGILRHMWTTIDDRSPLMLRGLRMDFFWDGAERPAISAPWGDFFGLGLGRMTTFESALFTCPEGRNFNSYIPMPFRKGMKITVTNETDKDLGMFWFQADCTVGDDLPSDALYFHACWRREQTTTLRQDYEFLPRIEGAGRYLGVNMSVIANRDLYFGSWWGEGEVKIYLDGDREYPTLCGTGTEDYIGTSWGQGKFANQYQGCPIADEADKRFAFYRYHVPDPIVFRREIRATIQQIGYFGETECALWQKRKQTILKPGPDGVPLNLAEENGGLFERADDWASCAYWYLDRPTNELPALAPLSERITSI